ncbi:hypothetical protein [Roseateles violae]|uniref:Uncharacterized protein n=1 Tax=Roseateles violae TaxID=3058042 RepID=A0ABT8E032_9BURK|nr:hypothetical protein [Pelomonas sp. PFR6]MDN3923221.1 hypothetical protein [Pelomonas sp. PFR6]
MSVAAKAPKAAKGFWLWVEPRPDTDVTDEVRFARAFEDYVGGQGLCLSGGPLLSQITGQTRSLSLQDQVNLIDWMLLQPQVRAVSVTPLAAELEPTLNSDVGLLRVPALDLGVIAVCLLYRMGRLKPEQYIEILGGYVRRVH